MKNMKICSLLLVLVMLLSVVAGCAVDATETSAPTEGPAAAATAAPPAKTEEPASDYFPLAANETVSMWYVWNPSITSHLDGPEGMEFFKQMEQRTNVTIEFTTVSLNLASEQFQFMSAGDDYTDIIMDATQYYTGGSAKIVGDGVVYNLAGLMDEYLPNYKAALESDPEYTRGVTNDDGTIPAFFLLTDVSRAAYGPVIRQDWLDELEMEKPVTYDDYYDVLTAFKTVLGADGPLAVSQCGIPYANYLIAGYDVIGHTSPWSAYGLFTNRDGTVVFSPATDNFYQYVEMMNKWYSEGLVQADFMVGNNPMFVDAEKVYTGQVGIFYEASGNIASYNAMDDSIEIAAIADAKQTADQQLHIRSSAGRVSATNSMAISTTVDNAKLETVARWLDYIYSEEGQLLANYGVEDLSFVYDAGGTPQFTELITNNPDGLSIDSALYVYALPNNLVGLMQSGRTDGANNALQQEALALWNEPDASYLYPTRATMTDDENEEFSLLYADIETYISENVVKFIKGERSMSEWNAFAASFDEMNINRCVEIKQAVLERYISR